jgi:hypothetical protein
LHSLLRCGRAGRTEPCHRHDGLSSRAVTMLTRPQPHSNAPCRRLQDLSQYAGPRTLTACLLAPANGQAAYQRQIGFSKKASAGSQERRLDGCCLFAATVSDPSRRRLCGAARAGWRRYPMSWPRSSVEDLVERGGSISDKRMQLIPGATLAVTICSTTLADLPPSNHAILCLA